jgi:glycosyltransferase involved in cell wall biosynthesis
MPYWVDRFNALADYPDIDLEVVFMRASDTSYAFKVNPSSWRFRGRVLSSRPGELGFGRASLIPRTLKSLAYGPTSTRLVMPYADATFILAALSARLRRMPYFLYAASTADDARSGTPGFEIAKRWMFKHAERCLATGPLQAEYVRRYSADARISIIGNPIDVSGLTPLDRDIPARRDGVRDERGWGQSFVVGFVGRLSEEKDLPTLIRAAALLGRRDLPLTIAVAGYGRSEGALRELAAELGVNLQFLGFLDGVELGDFYRSMDVFCLPSTSEPWGLVVNEATAMGLPVVVSDRVGSRTLLENDKSGMIFPAGDVEALAERLARLGRSSDLRSRMGSEASQAIRPQSIDAWADAVVSALAGDSATGSLRPQVTNEGS